MKKKNVLFKWRQYYPLISVPGIIGSILTQRIWLFHDRKNLNGNGYEIKVIFLNFKKGVFQLTNILADDTIKSIRLAPWSCVNKKTQMSESIFACSNCGVTLVFESKNVLGVFPMGVFHMKKRCEKLNHKTN